MKFQKGLQSLPLTVGYVQKEDAIMSFDVKDGVVKGQWADLPIEIIRALNFK